jgi:uncharacterized protein
VKKTVKIKTEGKRKIEGTLFVPKSGPRQKPGALFLHGWGSDRQRHLLPAELLSHLGFVCLAIDLRGHGKTGELEKSVSARDNLRDVMASYDYLTSRSDVDSRKILSAGFSYGGFLAILLAAEKQTRWLALRSPALYRDEDLDIPKSEIKRRGLMAFRRRILASTDNSGLRAAAAIDAHVLLIEAEHDRVIPKQQIRNYLRAFRRARSVKHRIIAGADHAMSKDEHFRAAVETMIHWLERKREI